MNQQTKLLVTSIALAHIVMICTWATQRDKRSVELLCNYMLLELVVGCAQWIGGVQGSGILTGPGLVVGCFQETTLFTLQGRSHIAFCK